MKELFLVIRRNKSGEVKVERTKDITQAICMQTSLLRDIPMEEAALQISEQEIESVLKNLKEGMMDMIQASDRDVTIVFLPPS